MQSEAGDASPTPGAAFSVQILHQRKARPKSDGTYIGEFKTADGEALAHLVFSPGGDGGRRALERVFFWPIAGDYARGVNT